ARDHARAAGERDAGRAQGQGRVRDRALEAADRGRRRLRRLIPRRRGILAGAARAAAPARSSSEGATMTFNRSDLGAGAIFIAIGLFFGVTSLAELDI